MLVSLRPVYCSIYSHPKKVTGHTEYLHSSTVAASISIIFWGLKDIISNSNPSQYHNIQMKHDLDIRLFLLFTWGKFTRTFFHGLYFGEGIDVHILSMGQVKLSLYMHFLLRSSSQKCGIFACNCYFHTIMGILLSSYLLNKSSYHGDSNCSMIWLIASMCSKNLELWFSFFDNSPRVQIGWYSYFSTKIYRDFMRSRIFTTP